MAEQLLRGIGVSPGMGAGPVVRVAPPPVLPRAVPAVTDPDAETEAALSALERVAQELERRAAATALPQAAEVLEATAMMARDPTLADGVRTQVRAHGRPAAWAVDAAIGAQRQVLEEIGGYLAERASDLDDVRHRAVAALLGVPVPYVPDLEGQFVLVAEDLAPADTSTLPLDHVQALVTERGGPTSHTAILARALGLPAVVNCAGAAALTDGVLVVVDGATGEVRTGVDDAQVDASREREGARRTRRASRRGPGVTSDGLIVELLANIGDAKGAAEAVEADAQGVGLFRTEFLYLDRAEQPSVDEQQKAYAEVLRVLGERKIVVRTLDAGADKPLRFLDLGAEPNPALGVRGLRTSRRYPQLLEQQLVALARAGEETGADLRVMAPMVATEREAASFADVARACGIRTVGAMVEVPAAALRAGSLLGVLDFLSIGTNDLAQYTLAVDRMAGELADLLDPAQPALLDLVGMTAQAGLAADKPVGVCGEAAADPRIAPLLVGLGVTSLSMSPRAIPDVREALAQRSYADCRRLAEEALAADIPGSGRL